VKQNKKAKICFVIYIAGFFLKNIFCYEVFVKQNFYKRSSKYYSVVPNKVLSLSLYLCSTVLFITFGSGN